MPELPEVEALATFLREHAKGRVVARADAASFAALKTFDPPLSALSGRSITDVGRHGKFLDLVAAGPMRTCTWSFTSPGPAGCAGARTSPISR